MDFFIHFFYWQKQLWKGLNPRPLGSRDDFNHCITCFFFQIVVQKKTYNINHCACRKKKSNFVHVGHCTANLSNPMPHLICYYLVFAQQVGFHVSSFHLLAYTNIAFHKGFTLIYIFWNIVENHQTWFELLGFNASWIHYEKLHLSKPYYLVIKTQKKSYPNILQLSLGNMGY